MASLVTHFWLFPGKPEPKNGGELHVDFVYEEIDLKKFAVNSFKWNSDAKESFF